MSRFNPVKDLTEKTPNSTLYNVWFKTHAEATDYAESISRNYHPAGYGTMMRIEEEDNYFVVRGYRANSCD